MSLGLDSNSGGVVALLDSRVRKETKGPTGLEWSHASTASFSPYSGRQAALRLQGNGHVDSLQSHHVTYSCSRAIQERRLPDQSGAVVRLLLLHCCQTWSRLRSLQISFPLSHMPLTEEERATSQPGHYCLPKTVVPINRACVVVVPLFYIV